MGMMNVMADEAYVVFTSRDSTLTFYYDNLKSTHNGAIYAVNDNPLWSSLGSKVAHVVFDSTFGEARPLSTHYWFGDLNRLTSLSGLNYLNTSEVRDMSSMFRNCSSLLHLDLSSFNTSKVTNMGNMFNGCSKLQSINLSSFDTEKVMYMSNMFSGCSSLTNLNLNNFNTSQVSDMLGMFQGCKGLSSLDLGSFNTKKVTRMTWMFYKCSSLRAIYVGKNWSTAAVTESDIMFKGCTNLKGGAGTTYDAEHVDASYAHIDGGTSNPGYLTGIQPVVAYNSSTKTLTFYDDGVAHSGSVGLIPSTNTTQPWWSAQSDISSNVQKVVFDPSFARHHPTSGFYWFANMTNLTSIEGLEYLNTDEMEIMQSMFRNCSKLTTLDLSHFNTSQVTNMYCMFMDCSSLTSLDVTSFNTSKVTNMSEMFSGCSNLSSLDVSCFLTPNVTSMLGMFRSCGKLTTLDLSSFNTNKVTEMASMFNGCSNLTTIRVSDMWTTATVTESNYMFRNCTKLKGGAGTTYDANHIDKTYARIDGGPNSSTPGYLTRKTPRRFKYNGVWYDDEGGSLDVSIISPQQGDTYTGEVVIPSKFTCNGKNYTTHRVKAGAFTGTTVTRVDLPGTIVVIDADAFKDATKLNTLVIGFASSPSYASFALGFANGNASNFICYVRNRFINNYEEAHPTIRFAPWVQISESYYTELHPYRPFSCKYNVVLPSGLEAYYVNGYDNSTRTAETKVVTGVIPSNTGLLLKGNENKIYLLARVNPQQITLDDNLLMAYKSGESTPWTIQDNYARFYFDEYNMEWTSTTNLFNYGSYLCIPKNQLGGDLTSPIHLDLEVSPSAYPLGDVNGDKKVDVEDVNAAINIILELKSRDDYPGNADVNGDGKVDIEDVNAIINIILTQ